jgi:Fe2+ or Zn2+ uptake regulation protein
MNSQLRTTLKQHKLSITAARQKVFEVLAGNEPLTMREVTDQCHTVMDKASVYRTIALYEKLGIVQRLQIGWKYTLELSNAFQDHHHHLTCIGCGVIHGYKAVDHQLEITGYCPACRERLTH